jgi:hypothetical protein
VACFDSDVCHGANEPRRTCSDNHLWGAAMFPLILAAVLFLSLLFLCGRYYLKRKRDLIADVLTGLLRAPIN